VASEERVHVVACGVLAIDIQETACKLGVEVTAELLEGGLHDRPGELRRQLQAAIDRASAAGTCDRIAVGYGICGRGAVGIHARNVPLAIPKAHDCIALFLGSDAAYKREFARFPGTYYISAGWFKEKVQPRSSQDGGTAAKPKDTDFAKLAEKYGEENARAIVDFLNSWKRNYQRAAFIDTGAGHRARYASYAKAMAEEFGWRYEELPGNLALLEKLLAARETTAEILIVPPNHVTTFDPIEDTLAAVPAWDQVVARSACPTEGAPARLDKPAVAHPQTGGRPRLGLGIDAGGTYTDVVIYDFDAEAVLAKGKALTTKWDYTIGIENALATLDPSHLAEVGLASVSTTLATNAIVEGHGQKVGLLVMPPYGLFDPSDILHEPKALLSARLEIDGTEIRPVQPEEVRQFAREMTELHGVGAFAVSGFAGTINPSHEMEVKAILAEATGLSVTCGHELSELLNFRTRADTAVLNARIIPRLAKLLRDVERSLAARGIRAPIMVVKGDGSLMRAEAARERPVETILSGPAASVAGARRLTDCADAFIVDMGGTTTDTAAVRGGAVRVCADGARVGRWKTHVRALDMRTTGLGGDSLIAYERRVLTVGPLRVAPVAWLASEQRGVADALRYLEAHLDDFAGLTRPMELLGLTGYSDSLEPTEPERAVLDALRGRPRSLAELAPAAGAPSWELLPLERLEEHHIIQRSGLTPTDLLHVLGQFERWDTAAARRLCDLVSHVAGSRPDDFIDRVMDQVVRKMAAEVLKKQLDEEVEADRMNDCPVCQALLDNLLSGGTEEFRVAVKLRRPIIGLGAPVHLFLPQAAALLGTAAIVPPHADVANAIGAITSGVVVTKQAQIRPNAVGGFAVHGLPGARSFDRFVEAHAYAVAELERVVQSLGRVAGAADGRVEVGVHDKISKAADGTEIFLERIITGQLSALPSLAP